MPRGLFFNPYIDRACFDLQGSADATDAHPLAIHSDRLLLDMIRVYMSARLGCEAVEAIITSIGLFAVGMTVFDAPIGAAVGAADIVSVYSRSCHGVPPIEVSLDS
jgi:hypothetical protein